MATGQYGSTDVPVKAIEAQEVIYQASTLLAATSPLVYPVTYQDLTYKFDVTKGVIGQHDVQMDAEADPKRLAYTQLDVNLKWSVYPYMINDQAKLNSREVNKLWEDASTSGAEYLAAIQDYLVTTDLIAGAANTHTADNYWNVDDGDPEYDIVTALGKIMSNSNVQANEVVYVVGPAKAMMELRKLNLIQNVQQQMGEYLEKSFDIKLIPFRPYIDEDGSAQLDGLDNDVIVCPGGKNTIHYVTYDPAEAARRGVSLVEHSRVHGRGDFYTQKMASASRVVWDGINATDTISNRIYKIADVVSAAL